MHSKIFAAVAVAIVTGAALPSFAAPAQPDLIVKFSTSNGRVQLRNIGNKKSKKALVTIVCKKISGRGSCPDPNPKKVAKYLNPAFPNAVVVKSCSEPSRTRPSLVAGSPLRRYRRGTSATRGIIATRLRPRVSGLE